MTGVAAVVTSVPELNQLVEARCRHWVVTEVIPSALDPDPLKGIHSVQHLVSLVSVDDGGHGALLAQAAKTYVFVVDVHWSSLSLIRR